MFYDLVEPAKSEPKTGTVESKINMLLAIARQPEPDRENLIAALKESMRAKRKPKEKPVPVLLGKLTRKWSDWAKGYKGSWEPGQEPPQLQPLD